MGHVVYGQVLGANGFWRSIPFRELGMAPSIFEFWSEMLLLMSSNKATKRPESVTQHRSAQLRTIAARIAASLDATHAITTKNQIM